MEDNVVAEQGQSGWRDIATAPEGTDVLVWAGFQVIAYFGERSKAWYVRWDGTIMDNDPFEKPTHWMPLPEPPK